MFRSIIGRAKELKTNLTSLDAQPVGKAALVVLIFLDLFILISIFDGLADHTNQLTTPEDRIPPYCRDIIIDAEWNPTTRLENIARITSEYHGGYFAPDEREAKKEQHALCQPITRLMRSVREDQGLSRNLRATLELQQESVALRSQLERIKGAYDTSLLEVAAEQRRGLASIGAIKKEITDKTGALNEATRKLALLESALVQEPRLRELFKLLDGVSEADRTALRDDLRKLNFWYPVRRLGMEMLFLLPLFAMFYFWNARSIARQRPFQTLVSSHLVVIALVPVFFKIVELIYDILPKKLLKHVIELLESLKLVALWHYLLMGVAILAALVLVYLFQKKLFSRDKLIKRRIAKGLCQSCNQQLPAGSAACPFCGFAQYRACSHCGSRTHVYGKYCKECGHGEDGLEKAESAA